MWKAYPHAHSANLLPVLLPHDWEVCAVSIGAQRSERQVTTKLSLLVDRLLLASTMDIGGAGVKTIDHGRPNKRRGTFISLTVFF